MKGCLFFGLLGLVLTILSCKYIDPLCGVLSIFLTIGAWLLNKAIHQDEYKETELHAERGGYLAGRLDGSIPKPQATQDKSPDVLYDSHWKRNIPLYRNARRDSDVIIEGELVRPEMLWKNRRKGNT